MTVLAGYAPGHRLSGVLELASAIATALDEELLVVTVTPPRWNVPSLARVDAEFVQWAEQQGQSTLAEARNVLEHLAPEAPVSYRRVDHRSASSALLTIAEEISASVVVVGSSEDGRRGRVELGSTSDSLVHSARLPVAIAPRRYEGPGDGFASITCSVTEHDAEADAAIIAMAAYLANRAGVPLRLVTFAVRLGTMYPSYVGYDAEDELANAAREHSETLFDRWRGTGVIADDVQTLVGIGHGWRAAIDSITWDEGGLLVLGSKPHGPLSQVFLGSSATKIVRHSPIPVLVLPAG